MANKKNKINELVSADDDATAELETPTFPHHRIPGETEAGESTCDFDKPESDSDPRLETIEKLQFDIEQLRARWLGLEAEINAREEITQKQQQQIDELGKQLDRKKALIRKRDSTIKSLKAEIRDRDDMHRSLEAEMQSLEKELTEKDLAIVSDWSRMNAGRRASDVEDTRKMQQQLVRTEEYADGIRQQLSDLLSSNQYSDKEKQDLQEELRDATARIEELNESLLENRDTILELTDKLAAVEAGHEEEVRLLRFELGEAQETVATSDVLNEQLASDLVDTRNYKEELERMLSSAEETSQSRIEALEKQLEQLQVKADEYEEKLSSKDEAISGLMEEIADQSRQLESISDIENVIHDIDERMSERIEIRAPRDKLTRLLVGKIEGQPLQFPLFKDRLTIGRAGENDIQLNAQFISRRHAVVLNEGDTTRVIDWGSKNGVFVNKKRITEHFLTHGDIVTIGTIDFRYEERPKRD